MAASSKMNQSELSGPLKVGVIKELCRRKLLTEAQASRLLESR